jgi:hypothetical protein
VTEIGSGAFSYCSQLNRITIPSSIGIVDESGTFEGCAGLTNITIGTGVIDIAGRAFFGCTHLTSLTIPRSVASIDHDALGDCPALRTILFAGNVPPSISPPVISGTTQATVYYLPGSEGWSSTFSGRFTVLWDPSIQVGAHTFGVPGQEPSFANFFALAQPSSVWANAFIAAAVNSGSWEWWAS